MRTTLVALFIAAALAVPSASRAQNTASENLTVSVNVIRALTLTKVTGSDLDFGINAAGTTPTAIAPGSGVQFEADGQANTQLLVTHSGDVDLTGPGDAIAFTANIVGNSTDDAGSAVALPDATNVTLSAGGRFYFWLGGSLAALPASQAPGTYSANWTLTVAY